MSTIRTYDVEDWRQMKQREEDVKSQMTSPLSTTGQKFVQPLPADAVTEIQKLKYRVKWLEDGVNSTKISPITMSEVNHRLSEIESRLPKKKVPNAKVKVKKMSKADLKRRKAAWDKVKKDESKKKV
jgi:hypothetical protein